jgi:AmmeMemoRadiSam system protein B
MPNEEASQPQPQQPQGEAFPPFDPKAPHQQRPRLRAVRGFPAQVNNQQVLGLSDARQISDRVVFTAPAVQLVLPMMDGQKTIDEIVTAVGRGLTREMLEQLVAQLDGAGLLFGPTFDAILTKMKTDFDSTTVLPPASTAAIADAMVVAEMPNATEEQKVELGSTKLREAFDTWISEALKNAPNPSFDKLPKAVVVPHIDYPRGWLNYASAWGRMRVVDRPARVVIFGTNHFGESTGIAGCEKGYQSPFGTCEPDTQLVASLKKHLGPDNSERLFANRYDHEREHSIELQIPWIQHCLGADDQGNFCKVFAALIHDPAVNNGESYDGKGLALDPFIDAMKKAVAELPGTTLFVSSADLSHCGPSFGDQQPLGGESPEADQARNKVFNHDREMIRLYAEGKTDEMIAAMAWQQNPTRWCSLGNMVATSRIAEAQSATVLNYMAAMDPEGMQLVSSVSMVLN